jgi:hypothetical protein
MPDMDVLAEALPPFPSATPTEMLVVTIVFAIIMVLSYKWIKNQRLV